MANAIVKTLKFARILNGRMSFSTVKHFQGHNFLRYYANQTQKTYATAVHKLELNEDSSEKNNESRSRPLTKDEPSIDSHIDRIDSLIRRTGRTQMKHVQELLSMITSKDVTSDIHALYLIRSCKYCYDEPPSKRIELLNQIWNRYQELGIPFDVQHYNAFLDVQTSNGLKFDPAQILASMEEHNIEPNKATYMLVMKKYCQDGNISGASEILEFIKEKQISIDENVFNYLIEGHIKNNDIQEAKAMVDLMRSSKLEPTADTHAILACGYAAVGDKEQMMAHLNKCGIANSAANHLKVISVLVASGNQQYIDDVFALIEDTDLFRQEIINCAVELIYKNHIDAAYQLMIKTHTEEYHEGVNIFIKQLMKAGRPPSEVANYCERVYKEGYNTRIYALATKISSENQQLEYTFALFNKMQDVGLYLRSSRFWSVIKEQKSPEGIWKVLAKMSEIGMPCDFVTYLEVFYPALGLPQPSTVLNEVKKSNQSVETAADALFVYYCSSGEIEYADQLTELHPVKISNRFDVRGFLNLHNNINERSMPKYFKLLKYIFSEKHKFASDSEVQGKLLADLLLIKTRLLENFLYKYQDFKFSKETLDVCEQFVRQKSPRSLPYLNRLRTFNSERGLMNESENLSAAEEDKYLARLQAQNITCRPFLIKRLKHHIRTKNVDRAKQLLSLYDELKLEYSPLILVDLLGMWCAVADLEKAKDTFDKLHSDYPEFKIEISKALDYTTLLLKYEKFEESYEILQQCMKDYICSNKDNLTRTVRRFNTVLSETQDIEFIRKMQNVTEPLTKEIGSKRYFVDSVIQVHLSRNDVKAAFEEFKNVVLTHRVPPCLGELYKKCISRGETEILQKVIDLTTSCEGKSFALIQLALAFIETYNTQKAATVLEKLGREIDPSILDDICEKLCNQGKLTELGQLLSITKSLSHVNREKLYHYVFKACVSRNDSEKALALVESMKNEGMGLDVESVNKLKNLLEKNNQTVPLSLMSNSEKEIISAATEATKAFMEHLQAGNANEALKELSELKKGYIRTLSIKTLTDLVDLCLQEECTSALSTNVHAMSYIIESVKDVLNPILGKYSEAGDIEKLKTITRFIPDFSLMSVNFNYHFGNAYVVCGKFEELLTQLEEHVDKKNKLFSSVAFEELLKLPEFEDRALNLAVKHHEANYHLPIGVVWAYYFSREKYEKAEEIHKNFTIHVDKVDVIVLKQIKMTENVSLAKKYIEFLNTVNVRMRQKERAYGAAIDLLVFKGMYDEASGMVVESEKLDLHLHKYYLSTLVTLKGILEKENKPVPFSLPELSNGLSSKSN